MTSVILYTIAVFGGGFLAGQSYESIVALKRLREVRKEYEKMRDQLYQELKDRGWIK